MPGFEGDAVAGDGVFDGAEWFCGGEMEVCLLGGRVSPLRAGLGFASSGAHGVTRPTIVCFSFDVREFPKVAVDNAGGALVDEEFAVSLDDESDKATFSGSFAFAEIGQLFLLVFTEGQAELLDWTDDAIR